MIEMFSVWLDGLIGEDKELGLHPVNRGLKAEHALYIMYVNKFMANRQKRKR